MKRAIKFRGKRLKTDDPLERWIEGSLVEYTDIYDHKQVHIVSSSGHHNDVSPETVGQFTGLCDIPAVSEEEFDETILRAIKTYGKDSQTQKLFEEMAELQDALCKLARGRDTRAHVCEEIADVLIMCLQMAQIYGPKAVENWINIKINRLKNRLDNPQFINKPDGNDQNS